MADVLQLEGFGSDISKTCSVVLCDSSSELFIPYEFISIETCTRILLVGEHSAGTRGLVAGENWSMILSTVGAAGARNWSLLASLRKHLIEPILIVIAPDVSIPAAIGPILEGTTLILFRWASEAGSIGFNASSVFFPLNAQPSQIVLAQRALWRGMALRTSDSNLNLIIQETRPQGLHLVSSMLEGGVVTISWYRPKDSNDMVLSGRQDSLAMWLGAISDRIIGLLKKTS